MAQQHNQFGQNPNQVPNTTYNQIPGLFPTSLPFQPNFQQAWPNSPSWQANGQYDFSGGNFTPGNLVPANGYFPGQQADYISLDNGEEFYGDQDHRMSGIHGSHSDQSSRTNPNNSLPFQSSPQNPSIAPKPPASSDSSQMLNTLRAKLMKQKAAAEKAKTPEATLKAPNGNAAGDKQVESGPNAATVKASEASLSKVEPEVKDDSIVAVQESSAQTPPILSEKVNKLGSNVTEAVETLQPPVSSFDIEALFSSVRATEAAKKDQQPGTKAPLTKVAEVKPSKDKITKDKIANKKGVKTTSAGKSQPLSVKEDIHQSLQDCTLPSEQLEQGEIREEPSKSTPPTTKISTPKASGEKSLGEKPPNDESLPVKTSNGISAAQSKSNRSTDPPVGSKLSESQTPKKDATSANESRGKSNINSQKPASPTVTKTPVTKPKDTREQPAPAASRNDRREERVEQHGRRGDYYDDRRDDRRGDYRESFAANPRYLYDRSKPYDREHDRDRSAQYDSFRPVSRSRMDEAAVETSEYRKTLVTPSQRPETKPEFKPTQKENTRPDSKASRVLEIRTAFPAPPSPEIEKGPSAAKEDNPEDAADIQDWLEMTGYFDKPYREKALARHRKLMELDRLRAELEMETKVDLEERFHLTRFSSLMPIASVEGRSFTPQVFSKPSMPPPPIPAKEVRNDVVPEPVQDSKEDVGIQIKDLARQNSITNTPRVEDSPRDSRPMQDSSALTPGLKRPHSGDLTNSANKPVEKLARTDSRTHSIDKKSQPSPTLAKPPVSASLESRISVNHGPRAKREYQARSRSPEIPRRRSPSPLPYYRNAAAPLGDSRLARRLSDDDGYSPLRRPDLDRDVSPHMRGGPPYDGIHDNGPRYERYRNDFDTRSNASYDNYPNDRRGGSYRGRGGRSRGRAGYVQYRGSYSKTFDRRGSD